jgi:FkbM family methyltransferase
MSVVVRGLLAVVRSGVALLSTRPPSFVPNAIVRAVVFVASLPLIGLLIVAELGALLADSVEIEHKSWFGSQFICRPPDMHQVTQYVFDAYEPDVSRFIERRLSAGDTFIDIGSNVGYYTLLASHLVGSGGHVVAVEASPTIFAQLQRNLSLNAHASNVRAVNVAVSDRSGSVDVFSGPPMNRATATTSKLFAQEGRFEAQVKADSLAGILTDAEIRTARLIKIDCEGAEIKILKGIGLILDLCRPDVELAIELTPSWWDEKVTLEESLQPLLAAGFHVYDMPNSYTFQRYLRPWSVTGPRRIRDTRSLRDTTRQVDLVFSRRDLDSL